MNWYKTSATVARLLRGTHDVNKQPIVYIEGNTYPIRQQLGRGGLDFAWFGTRKIWWMYESRFLANKDKILEGLQKLNIDISALSVTSPPNASQTATPNIPEVSSSTESPEVARSTVKTDKTTTEPYNYVSFPVNKNIYETDIPVEFNGQPLTLHFVIGREKDHEGHKTFPLYTYKILLDEAVVRTRAGRAPAGGKWTKAGPNYDEDLLVSNVVGAIPRWVQDPKSHLYQGIQYEFEYRKHEPDLVQLLEEMEKRDDRNKDWSQVFPKRSIRLEKPVPGDYPIKISPWASRSYKDFRVELLTDIEHQLAPSSATLEHIDIPVMLHNLQQVNQYIDQFIQEHQDEIKQRYTKYLKSFAFTEEQRAQATQSMQGIIDDILTNKIDVPTMKRELMQRGYIRPRKGRGEGAAGLSPMSGFHLIIDDAKIRQATFARGAGFSPDYFYTAIAYNLMRIKHHNIGFMPILLEDAYRTVADYIKRFVQKEMTTTQVADYIDKVARALYVDLTGRSYQSWDEVYSDFYGGNWGNGNRAGNIPSQAVTGQFIQWIASQPELGITREIAQADPRGAYRKAALYFHPDSTPLEDKAFAEQKFKELNSLWNATSARQASFNWYKNQKFRASG